MATKVLRLVNGRLKFPYRKQRFFTYPSRRLLYNALIQPHYDYACSAWYLHLVKDYWKKLKYPKINVSDIARSLTTDPMLVLLNSKNLTGYP